MWKKFAKTPKINIISEQYTAIYIDNPDPRTNAKEHGFYGWKSFFPKDFSEAEVADILKRVNLFKQHIASPHFDRSQLNQARTSLSFTISYKFLKQDTNLTSNWPTFDDELKANCEQTIACLGLAMHQTIIEDLQQFSESIYEYEGDMPYITPHLIEYEPVLKIIDLKVEDYGKLVSIYGTIIKTGYRRGMKCTWMTFKCSQCGGLQLVKQLNYEFTPPRKCLTTNCKKSTDFQPLPSSGHTIHVDQQNVKIQEVFTDQEQIASNRARYSQIECNLKNGLLNNCAPGDDVTVVGILRVNDSESQESGLFSLHLDCISLVNYKEKVESMIAITEEDYYEIRSLQEMPDLFRVLVHSLCPYIYGHEAIKAGLLLAMFGGKKESKIRSNSHVLLIGDPGLGKSQMLKACSRAAPRGMYVCGVSSTNTGLTLSVTRENGGFGLEGGALLLADNGVCCLDEFDKMSQNQQQALVEVMEQQSVSLAKAGIVCSLPARTKIIAAANPYKGHYDKSKSLLENLNLPQKILGRFDLIFLLLDQPNEQQDAFLSDHIVGLRTRVNSFPQFRSASSLASLTPTTRPAEETWKDRLKLKPDESLNPIPTDLLKKYVTYAQQYINPTLTEGANVVLKNYFFELISKRSESDCIPITSRMLESLKRLTEARAKLELRAEATENDAKDVVEIFNCSNIVPLSHNELLNNTSSTFKSAKNLTQKQIDGSLQLLSNMARVKGQKQFTRKELKELLNGQIMDINKTNKAIDLLNERGSLLMKGNDSFLFIGA